MRMKGELHRDMDRGQIAGVCAGVAEYFGWELWLVRIITVSGFLLTGSAFFVGYIIAWMVLDKKTIDHEADNHQVIENEFTSDSKPKKATKKTKVEVKSKVWQAGEPPAIAFNDIERRFGRLEKRLRRMESYVTSSEFELNREFRNL